MLGWSAGLPSVLRVSDKPRADGWEALRSRLEASAPRSSFRGGWVPRRRGSWAVPDPPVPSRDLIGSGACEADDLPALESGTTADGHSGSITRSHIAVVALITVAALIATALVLWRAQPSEQAVPLAAQASATPAAGPTGSATPTPSATLPAAPAAVSPDVEPGQPAEVVVHVAGKVRRPGVVRLPAGARVIDAVDAAGGARNGADLSSVNLARELTDGEQVRVGLPADPGIAGIEAGTGAASAGPLDLNSASATDLETLPGVGPVLAERIVAYRDQSGPFRTIDQLIEVAGIGPAVLDDVTDLVRV